MLATLLTERCAEQIAGSCYDRLLIFVTLPSICRAAGMTSCLYLRRERIFDSPRFAQKLRDELIQNTERWPQENGIETQFLPKRNVHPAGLQK